jgi:hypothetical protein
MIPVALSPVTVQQWGGAEVPCYHVISGSAVETTMPRTSAKARAQDDALGEIVAAYKQWCKDRNNAIPTTSTDAFVFFTELETAQSRLLDPIRAANKWKVVRPRLEGAGLVRDLI